MKFHTFGSKDAPKMILIHGVLTPWQIWNKQIEHFSKNYYVIVVALNAHVEEEVSEFVSIEKEAECIEAYCIENYSNEVFAVCGLSMGGTIAHILWKNQKIRIRYLILDGAPLISCGKMMKNIMIKSYIDIIRKSKARDSQTIQACKRDFLPEKYLDSYLHIADKMSENSIINMVTSISNSTLDSNIAPNETKIIYIHGTKANELLSKLSAKRLKKFYPETNVVYCKGYAHCCKAIYEPAEWIQIVDDFLLS